MFWNLTNNIGLYIVLYYIAVHYITLRYIISYYNMLCY